MPLKRQLTLSDAVVVGMGSMIGAGVFAVWGPVLSVAGNALLAALAIAAIVAFCNATASAQLAAVHPVSGGTYAYARAEIGPWAGFIAGWCFLIGKVASCAAMAMTFAAYAAPTGFEVPIAVLAVAALVVVNCFGVTRTALLTRILVIISLIGLAIVVAAGAIAVTTRLTTEQLGWYWSGVATSSSELGIEPLSDPTAWGVLQGAALLFFAFAGYARIATMGEEVVTPRRTIPRAIIFALTGAVIVYTLVGLAVILTLGADAIATATPLADVLTVAGWTAASPILHIAAATASLGALLALLTGIGRTTLAMAREEDLPRFLAVVDERWSVPRRAEIAIGVIVIAIILVADLRGAIAFSSFGVLLYYLIANVAAFRQSGDARRYPRALQILGAIGCLTLVATLPAAGILIGVCVIIAGVVYRVIRIRVTRSRA
ncbi:APC family permease [Microbacterium sp. YY-03]|uniref:APC family permease n=1 Tax=Microbacterium sp. YY-03 TaxID=3421636 RepID=UPI003D177D9A